MLVELRGAESLACYLQIRKQVRVCGGWFCVLSPALESEYADGNGLQDAACAVRFLDLSGLCPGARNVVRFGMVCFPPSEVLA